MVLSLIAGLVFIILIGTLWYFWKETEYTELEGIILRKIYEATEDRFYFVIEINGHDIYSEYCEYTCSKEEWLQFEQDETIKCMVHFYLQETLIKSIKKK